MICTGDVKMGRIRHIRFMASYNELMNARLYEAASQLPISELTRNRNAFFGSILATLNHIAVGDTIWLKRFARHPANYSVLEKILALPDPYSLDHQLFSDLESLASYRKMLDVVILDWAEILDESELDHALQYASVKGIISKKNFFSLIMHFFNHQTHHRGQASTLLFQAGIDIGVTDLVSIIPNEEAAAI